MFDDDFYRGKRILITGHTGFKGTWICQILHELGADITGYALQPPTSPSLFVLTGMAEKLCSVVCQTVEVSEVSCKCDDGQGVSKS